MRADPNVAWFHEAKVDQLPLRIAYDGAKGPMLAPAGHTGLTTVACGFLSCDVRPFNPLIATLPRLLHLRAADSGDLFGQFIQRAVAESHGRRPGGEAMLARMSEMLFVDAVRRYLDSLPPDTTGWLAGLRDPFVGRALALLHEKPAKAWTLEESGPAGRVVTFAVARALRAVRRSAADAVPDSLAHAACLGPAAQLEQHGRHDRARGRLPLGGGLCAGVQAAGGPATGGVAAYPRSADPGCRPAELVCAGLRARGRRRALTRPSRRSSVNEGRALGFCVGPHLRGLAPISRAWTPRRPCKAIMIRSQACFSAASTITAYGISLPSERRLQVTPFLRRVLDHREDSRACARESCSYRSFESETISSPVEKR